MKPKINHLQHVGLPVTNLENSESFYKRLGFLPVMNATFMYGGAEGKVSMMQLNNIVLELYQMPEPELINIKLRKDGRIDHIAFDVDNIDATFKLLKEEGFSVIEESPVHLPFWKNGCRYFNISGPDGERLEFNQIL